MFDVEKYHTVAKEIERLARVAFRRNLLAETLCSILYTGRSRDPSDDDSATARLFEGFFDSSPIVHSCQWW